MIIADNDFTYMLIVRVTDEKALYVAAANYLVGSGNLANHAEARDELMIEGDEIDVHRCLRYLLDRHPAPPGVEIIDSEVTD
jgi:hypothetical protein